MLVNSTEAVRANNSAWVKQHRGESQRNVLLHIKSTWQRCSRIRPPRCLSVFQQWQHCQETHKNKLFAITAVPMGTGARRVCPRRHSSAQTVCLNLLPQHATRNQGEEGGSEAGGGGGRSLHHSLHHPPEPISTRTGTSYRTAAISVSD